jgi:hypothetical protein
MVWFFYWMFGRAPPAFAGASVALIAEFVPIGSDDFRDSPTHSFRQARAHKVRPNKGL